MTRTIAEVRGYLRTQVNSALRRLGMYGDELSLILLFDALAYAEGIDDDWARERAALRERGWFVSTGVRGAMERILPDVGRGDSAIASVYAEFAHRVGWLTLDRMLTEAEYQALRTALPDWREQDRTISDVTESFGPPCTLLGPTSPLYPKTLLYMANGRPIVCFHLWNGHTETGSPGSISKEPMLLAVRIGDLRPDDAIAFTPEGLQRRPNRIRS